MNKEAAASRIFIRQYDSSPFPRLNIQQITECFQRTLGIVSQNFLGQYFAKLYPLLVKAVDIPYKALIHHLILKMG